MVLNLVFEKHLILHHGEIYLVSCVAVEKGGTYSKRELPRVGLNCNIDEYESGIGWRVVAKVGKAGDDLLQMRGRRGAENLIKKLENHSMNKIQISIILRVTGLLKVVKSIMSISLKGSIVPYVGVALGLIRFVSEVQLDKKLLSNFSQKVPNCDYAHDFLRNIAVWEKLKKVRIVGANIVVKSALHDGSKEVSSSSPLKFDKIVEDDTLPQALTQVNGDDQPMDFEEYSILEKEIYLVAGEMRCYILRKAC
ncbi:hypothetical protein BUALT_Bualt17G0003300 [Buddleja alternifolia]|uniref:Uncharacterized protein n=1 Tax=Buddleja alternifolia TaxID=168488 RepID=A0AAV6WFP5_9LAMI|nr:hypothetical protein BUALT_Bualt17G0003300 [Buddleja alternifolia]